MRILVRQGEGAAGITRLHQERAAARANLERNIAEAQLINSNTITRATAGGDERKLRGIPAIGRGVAGHIPGTSPHAIR